MSTQLNQPARPYATKAGSPRNTNNFLYILAISILSVTMAASCKSNDKATQQAQQVQDNSAAIRDSLQSQFNAARVQIDQLTTYKATLDSAIRLKDAQIAKLKNQVGHLSKDNKSLAAKLKKDDKFIASLKDELSDKARSYAERLGLLQSDRDNLAMQRDSLMSKYNALRELGSVLDASNFRLEPIHLKHHGRKEKATKRARKVDILRVQFDIDENRIAENGPKKLYLVMTDPNGKLLSNTDNSSGTITANNGTIISYSSVKEIMLRTNEPVKDVTIDWKQNGDYSKGDYSIGIYNGGYRIGGGKVSLN